MATPKQIELKRKKEAAKRSLANSVSNFASVDSTVLNNIPNNLKPKGLAKFASLLTGKVEKVKQTLAPTLFQLSSSTGIDFTKGEVPQVCPTPTTLIQIITTRNKIIDQLNTLMNFITRVTSSLTTFQNLTQVIQNLLQIASIAKIVNSIVQKIAVAAPILAPLSSIGDDLQTITSDVTPKVKNALSKIDTVTLTILTASVSLNKLVNLTKLIDNLIQNCAYKYNINQQVLEFLTQKGKKLSEYTQSEINELINLLNQTPSSFDPENGSIEFGDFITGNLTLLSEDLNELNQVYSEIQPQDKTDGILATGNYKGYNLEVVEVPYNERLIRNIGYARDASGEIRFKSDLSFTLNPQQLIEELKIIIDKYEESLLRKKLKEDPKVGTIPQFEERTI